MYGTLLGLLPHLRSIKVDYLVILNPVMKKLFTVSLECSDSPMLYFTGRSHGMIPEFFGLYYPEAYVSRWLVTRMAVEHIGEVMK